MSTELEIASFGVLFAYLLLMAAMVTRLRSRSRAQEMELARLANVVASQGMRLAEFTTPSSPQPREANVVTVPARRHDEAESRQPKKPVLIAVPDLAPAPPESVELPAELVQRFGAIWELADSGASIDAIARATGHPIGQVELIMGLRRTRPAESARRTQ